MKEFKSILVKDKKQMNKNKNKKIQFLDKKCNNIPLTMKLNEFESDLGSWTICVFAATTTGLLFYHMTRLKSLKMNPLHASIFAILLLICAVLYITYSLYNFYSRTGYLFNKRNKCTEKIIKKSRIIYTIITSIIILVLIGICIQIIINTKDYF
jgi:hypothetical protein